MLWSAHAMKSRNVQREGRAGFERAALVPVLLSKAQIPRAFGSIQFADLTTWGMEIRMRRYLESSWLPFEARCYRVARSGLSRSFNSGVPVIW
jgi:hypothetical protein